jgi:predicted NBD/HSP70 family sugar kinase
VVPQAALTQDDLRHLNRARVLRRLHAAGPATRSELVAFTGLNRSTIGVVVTELVEAGLVLEQAGQPGQVGRPSLRVVPNPESAVVVTLDLRVGRTVAALVGVGGAVLARMEQRHPRSYAPEVAVRTLVSIVADLLEQGPPDAVWAGVGVGVPGTVEHRTGRVHNAPNLGWSEVPFAEMLREGLIERFGPVPSVVVGNDADLGAIAEHVRGRGVDCRNLVYVTADVGVGGGVIVDGRPLIGAGGIRGEVGHMVVDPRGAQCRCGARGCWETVIGTDAILRAARVKVRDAEVADAIGEGAGGDDADLDDICVRAAAGDALALSAVEVTGEWIGIGLANLVNILDPDVIVLGGHLRLLYPLVSDMVEERVALALPSSSTRVQITVPELGGDSTLLGAAETAFEELLADPLAVVERHRRAVAS